MHENRLALRALAGLAVVVVLGAGTSDAFAAPTHQVVDPDPVGDVRSDGSEAPGLVAATDVTKVAYRLSGSAETVKVGVVHGGTLRGARTHHRAVTTFTHDGSHYRLVFTLDSAAMFVRDGGAWKRLHPRGLAASGGDGRLSVRFPVSVLRPAYVMEDLRTRLVVAGTSIVDRTSTDEGLPVYPPR